MPRPVADYSSAAYIEDFVTFRATILCVSAGYTLEGRRAQLACFGKLELPTFRFGTCLNILWASYGAVAAVFCRILIFGC